ncbi:hypothetical protein F5H01DRAFT_254342, partial [Linnemannia elongata]
MYVTCGQLSGFYMNDIVAFDMKTLNGKNPVWTMIEPKSSMPPARAGHCAASYDGKVYIFGGADDKYYYNDIWCFDPSNKRWEAVPAYGTLPTSRQGHTCVVIEDTMYIYGGMNHEDQLLGDLCAFKFTERRWVTIGVTEAASARTEHAMCNVGDRIYIFGGQLDLNANEDSGLIHVLETCRLTPADDSQIGQRSPSRLSIEFNEATHVARRRTIGKPVGYVVPEAEVRGTQSIDEVRRPPVNESLDLEIELKDLKQREQWLMAEVSMARKRIGDRPLSMAIMALEDELENCEVDSEKYRIMQALLNVKAELERSKTTIATQAQIASNKVREAERVRTSALQEAAYLKAKVSALESGEVSALVSTETARAMDLEKRLTNAMAQLDKYEAQFVQYETILEHEKHSREAAEDREREASSRAEDAQIAHTRALTELTSLHERASVAEASLRETVAKSATSEAGLSSYQQQSAALDLGDTMLRLSQLEQTSMTARADAATAQRQLTEHRGKVTMLQAQLIRKEEAIEEMIKEQENNEAQLGLLR